MSCSMTFVPYSNNNLVFIEVTKNTEFAHLRNKKRTYFFQVFIVNTYWKYLYYWLANYEFNVKIV